MSKIKSPCVRVCVYNLEENYCTGCFRDLHDIDGWFAMNNTEKREALKRCKENRRRDRRGRHWRAKPS